MPDADLILLAETIHTLDPARPHAGAVAVRDGRIVAIGDGSDVRGWRGAGTEVIDLGTSVVTPGLVDGHIHPVMGLDMVVGTDLSAVRDLPHLVDVLHAAGSGQAPTDWVLGWGLDPNVFGGLAVTNAPLVEALGDAPVFLTLFDGHSALVSPRALEIAGVRGPRVFDQTSEVVCGENGAPTGHLLELPAMQLVRSALPAEEPARRRARLAALLTDMASVGLTAGNAMDFEGDSADLFRGLEDQGELPIRMRFAPFSMPGDGKAGLEHVLDLQRLEGRRWEVEGVKLMIDGTIDGGTAWLDEPDRRGESVVPLWPDPGEYAAAVRFLAARGVPSVTHAIGDAGVAYVLDALSEADPAPRGIPHRIEHIETIPSSLLGRFRDLGVTASMQPTHCTHYTRADQTDNWSSRLGAERAGRAFRTRDLRDAGATLALGSDWPIAPYDPRAVLADAQLRRPAGQPGTSPVGPHQALTAMQALEGYTSHAAFAAGLHGVAGRVAVGCRADLTVFAVDPLLADPDELAEAPIAMTVVGGSVVHRNPEGA